MLYHPIRFRTLCVCVRPEPRTAPRTADSCSVNIRVLKKERKVRGRSGELRIRSYISTFLILACQRTHIRVCLDTKVVDFVSGCHKIKHIYVIS